MTQQFLLTDAPNKLTRAEALAGFAKLMRDVEKMEFRADVEKKSPCVERTQLSTLREAEKVNLA